MPIVQNGRSPVGIRWVDEDGVEHQIIRVMLGDRIIFDGTMPVITTAPRANGVGQMMIPGIGAGVVLQSPRAAGAAEALVPLVRTATHLKIGFASTSGEMLVPRITLGSTVNAPEVPSIVAEMLLPVVGESAPGEFNAQVALASVEMLLPTMASPISAAAPTAAVVSEMLVPKIDTGANAEVPVMTATAEFIMNSAPDGEPLVTSPELMTGPSLPTSQGSSPMRVVHGHNLPASPMTAAGQMFVPMIPQPRTVTAPVMDATGAASVPLFESTPPVQAMGAIKGSNQTMTSSMSVIALTVPDPAHPGSVITTNGIQVVGEGQAVVKARAMNSAANSSNSCRVYINGVAVGSTFSSSATAQFGGDQTFTVHAGDLIQLWGSSTGSISTRRIFNGDGTKAQTYLEVLPA